jgi:Glycosyl hydrolases family 16
VRRLGLLSATAVVGAVAAAGLASDPQPRERPVFQDNFSGTALAQRWSPYHSPGNGGNGLRRASAIKLDGRGHLVITAQMKDGAIVSGGMAARRSQAYGRYEFRVRTERDATDTMSGVVLTWPSRGEWPAAGENDIYETGNHGARSAFHSYVHYDASNQQHSYTHRVSAARWHTLAMDWRRDAIRIYRDGRLVWTVTDRSAIPDGPHFLAVQLDATAQRTLERPVRMYVDYVRIYR